MFFHQHMADSIDALIVRWHDGCIASACGTTMDRANGSNWLRVE
jgi:hypothetical protein